jgi:DnaJ-class molecular chaperone
VIPNEGMPFVEDFSKKGDLIVEFDIEFPRSLSSEGKELVKKALIPQAFKKEGKKQSKKPNFQIQSSDFED